MLRVVYRKHNGEYGSLVVLRSQLNTVRRILAQGGLKLEFIVRESK
jgi:hypothetical protein